MTVIYDAKDHVKVIFTLHGSVWPSVLPWCVFNTVVTCTIWALGYYEVADLTFDVGLGYSYLSVLVSFFVISNINTTYNRLWEARDYLGKALFAIATLSMRAALYSAKENGERSKIWRNALKTRLIDLLRTAMYQIQDERASTLNIMGGGGALDDPDGGRSKSDTGMLIIALAQIEKKPVPASAFRLEAAILSHADYLDQPLLIQHEMDLLGRATAFFDAFGGLLKFSTTPRPFPTVQMGRTLLFVWVLSLPFALVTGSDEVSSIVECSFLVFLITYGFIGLTFAEIEMHDPLGKDANDLETTRYMKLIEEDIELFLGNDAFVADSFDLDRSYGAIYMS